MPTPNFTRVIGSIDTAGATVASLTYTLPAGGGTTGNAILVATLRPGAGTVSVSDSKGNTYTNDGTRLNVNVGAAINSAPALTPLVEGDTITVTLPSAFNNWGFVVLEQSNSHGKDVSSTNVGTSTAAGSGSMTTTFAEDIIIDAIAWVGATTDFSAVGAGFTQATLFNAGTNSMVIQYRTVTATGAYTGPATLGSSREWTGTMVAYHGDVVRYVDPNRPDDTGDGLSWATAKKNLSAVTPLLPGDQIRIAKSADPTALTGTLTWNNNSTTVTTSANLTATLAAGNLIGPASDGSQGWWEIASITSTTITLVAKYFGTTQTIASFRLNGFDAGAPATASTAIQTAPAVAGTAASPIRIIGGYDTTSNTRTGFTDLIVSGATKTGYGWVVGANWQQFSYLGCHKADRAFNLGSPNSNLTFSNCRGAALNTQGFAHGSGQNVLYDNCIVATCASTGIAALDYCTITNSKVLGPGGTGITYGAYALVDNCSVQGHASAQVGFVSNTGGRPYTLSNSSCTNPASGGTGQYGLRVAGTDGRGSVYNFTSSGQSGADVHHNATADAVETYFFNCNLASTTPVSRVAGILRFDRWQQAAGVYRSYLPNGNIFSNTAQARADTAVELQPTFGLVPGSAPHPNQFLELRYPIPAQASTARSVSFYVRDLNWAGNVFRYGIRIQGNFVVGPTTYIPGATYVQRTVNYTPTEDAVMELVCQCDGSSGSILIDDVAWT